MVHMHFMFSGKLGTFARQALQLPGAIAGIRVK